MRLSDNEIWKEIFDCSTKKYNYDIARVERVHTLICSVGRLEWDFTVFVVNAEEKISTRNNQHIVIFEISGQRQLILTMEATNTRVI